MQFLDGDRGAQVVGASAQAQLQTSGMISNLGESTSGIALGVPPTSLALVLTLQRRQNFGYSFQGRMRLFLFADMGFAESYMPGEFEGADIVAFFKMTKLQRFDDANIKQSDHVLEVGAGRGSFAINAARQPGCRVTSLTLSKEQQQLAEDRIREAGFSDRIEVKLIDYRKLPMPEKPLRQDRLHRDVRSSGREYMATHFSHMDRLLNRDGGAAMFQCITMPEGRYEVYSKRKTPSHKGQERVGNIGGHYARALRICKENFSSHFELQIRPALKLEHPAMTQDEINVFRRKWGISSPKKTWSFQGL
ncbi:putative Cyclopropane-fatty-acyl-phospholipid synthase [Seiridium cardinale]